MVLIPGYKCRKQESVRKKTELMNKYIVITTINKKTESIIKFESMNDWHVVIVGDKKSMPIKSTSNLTFLSIEDQYKLGFKYVSSSPYNHYARKNIGYLYAMRENADVIYDTDDDNTPYDDWGVPDFICDQRVVADQYMNVYKLFSREKIWPRGFPIDEIEKEASTLIVKEEYPKQIGVWQGLADLDPDVDAIFRLIVNKKIKFDRNERVFLDKGTYCPFNSQNTAWMNKAFPCLYLPSSVSFRFTDILRGYITQRILWEQELYLGFTHATVYQNRNAHDLMRDFRDEVECYLGVKTIVDILEAIQLNGDPVSMMMAVYENLVSKGCVKSSELETLNSWINDVERIR